MGTGQYPGAGPKPTAGAPFFSGHRAPSVSPAAARCHVPVDRRQRMDEPTGERNASTLSGLSWRAGNGPYTLPPVVLRQNEAKMTNALALFLAYPHWLIVAGTILLVLGLIGISLFGRRDVVDTELDDGPKLTDKEAP
jgi:hypothetical protein